MRLDWVYRNATSGPEKVLLPSSLVSHRQDKNDHNTKLAGAVFKVTSTTDPSKTWFEKLPAVYNVQEMPFHCGCRLNTVRDNLTVSATARRY